MTWDRPKIMVLVPLVALAVLPSISLAQIEQGAQGAARGTTTNYHFAEPNELTITVGVLGAVRLPGRYEISRKIDLLNLLALAGGTTDNADLEDVSVYRVLAGGGRAQRKELKLDLRDLTAFQSEPFELQQDDFVHVGQSSALTMQEVLSYVSTVALATVAVITIVRLTGPGGGRTP